MKTLTTAIELLSASNAPQATHSTTQAQTGNDYPPPLEDAENTTDTAELEKRIEEAQKEMERKVMQTISEKMKFLEIANNFDRTGLVNLPIHADNVYPEKFKSPEFEKYDGTGCPVMHTRLYVRKMAKYAKYEQVMIETFQESLTGPALTWYAQLDFDYVNTWDKLARAFYNQYKFNIEVAPTVWDLSNLRKLPTETFKEYAQRWRSMAAKISTPVPEKDLTLMFINTLGNPYYQHLVRHITSSFAEIVAAGCGIEGGIASGKLPASEPAKPPTNKPYSKPKEATVSFLNTSSYPNQAPPTATHNPNTNQNTTQNPRPQRRRQFTNIPVPLSQILARLRKENLVNFELPRKDYKPKDYNPELRCEYHLGQIGRVTDLPQVIFTSKFRVIILGLVILTG